ncbi:hypothetical protein [Pandoraea sputorum]|uniref:Uncharacterized protein n=1 Tax=Pandoraea sputorum TaxID=93222 RepID=A0A5E5ATX6_9BURK|nr:hypothetical protein [Pandoraea sputorum]VVE76466.1 hypothetical protein PSP31121_00785 [Pandoraea sputorum]
MPLIPETIGQKAPAFDAPNQSPDANRIDLLKGFTRLFKDDGCPEDKVIDDFMQDFEHTKLLDEVLGDMPEAKRKEVLRGAARCHVASFGHGRDFLAIRNQLHLVGQDCMTLFGALPASLRQTMLAHAYVGDRGQIVLECPDVGLSMPLGRTLLGTGDSALTTHEVRELLMFPERAAHWRLEIFSAKLRHFSAGALDAESCHVWVDLIDRYMDGKPIVEFSEDKAVLEALAYTLKELAERASVWERRGEFPMRRMLTNSAEAYFLAQDHKSCGAALTALATFHACKLEREAAIEAGTLAASVLARNALKRWEDGRFSDALVSYGMALHAYAGNGLLRDLDSVHPVPRSGVVDEAVPLPALVEPISRADFEAAWEGRWATTGEMRSQTVSDLIVLGIEKRLAKLRAAPWGSGTSK